MITRYMQLFAYSRDKDRFDVGTDSFSTLEDFRAWIECWDGMVVEDPSPNRMILGMVMGCIAVDYILLHEISHYICEHCIVKKVDMESQAAESQADLLAAIYLYKEISGGEYKVIKENNITFKASEDLFGHGSSLIYQAMISIASLFNLFDDKEWLKQINESHPSTFIRRNHVVAVIGGFHDKMQPHFEKMMRSVMIESSNEMKRFVRSFYMQFPPSETDLLVYIAKINESWASLNKKLAVLIDLDSDE